MSWFFFKNVPSPGYFLFILSFSSYNFNNPNSKSVDGMLGIPTQGHRMVGAYGTTEL